MAKKEQKNQGVKLAIRQAGQGGVTKKELNNITKTTGANAQTVVRRLDQVNQKLKSKDTAQIGLNSGAANMLINQNSKNPMGMFSQGKGFGSGQIGKTLTGMMGSRESGGYINPQSGKQSFASGKTPQMMIGGTQIRGGGRVAVKGFGKQYTYSGGTGGAGPYDGMEINPSDPNGPGPFANDPNLDMLPEILPEEKPEEEKDPGSGMLSGGGTGAAGATKLGRSKSRLRQLGIYGRGTGLLGRGLQYGNALNA
jgi:hypothetical protein